MIVMESLAFLKVNFHSRLDAVNVFIEQGFEVYCTPVRPHDLRWRFLAQKDRLHTLPIQTFHHDYLHVSAQRFNLQEKLLMRSSVLARLEKCAAIVRSTIYCFIGDACESLDPIAGMGMTHALISAKNR